METSGTFRVYDTFRPVALSWDASTLQKTFGNVWGTLLVVTAGSGRFLLAPSGKGPGTLLNIL